MRNKNFILARSKLNSIESMISKPLIDSEISHGKYTAIINEEEKYRRLKETKRRDIEKHKLIEGKRIGINKVIREDNSNI